MTPLAGQKMVLLYSACAIFSKMCSDKTWLPLQLCVANMEGCGGKHLMSAIDNVLRLEN